MATKEWKEENIEKVREYRRNWYNRNKKKARDKVDERKQSIVEWFKEYKSTLKCEKCSENPPATLDFHHTVPDEKKYSISKMVKDGFSKKNILKEMSKCEVLCSNCHRKHHYDNGF